MRTASVEAPPVLIVDLAKRFGGTGSRVVDICRSLHGHRSYAAATLRNSPLHKRLEAEGLVSLPLPFGRADPRLLTVLWRSIRRGGYKVIDAHNPQSQFWGHLAGSLAGVRRKVSTVHSVYRLEHGNSLRGRAYETVLRLSAALGSDFIAVAEPVEGYLQHLGVASERIHVVHSGVSAPGSVTPDRGALRREMGWDGRAYVIIVVARLEPVKGHRYLIEALSQVVHGRPEIRCLVVGDGRSRSALEAHVRAAGLDHRVRFTGFRDDVPRLLAASDAFCLPSLTEALPYTVLEASLHRLPLLLTAVGGISAQFSHGQTAFLVPPGDPDALAGGIRWLVDQPAEARTLGQAAFDLVEARFGLREMVAKTLRVYEL